MFLTFSFTCENKNGSIFCKAQLFLSFIKMRVSEQVIVLSDCFPECPCLYDKRTREYHKRDITGNCWKEVAKQDKKMIKFPLRFFKLYISMLLALDKSRSVRGASQQPAFMGDCLNISHTC